MKKYTYDAFISYRHTELDKFAAENLHKMMEAFRLPGNISKKQKEGRTKIERVFRDKEELPLTSNLEDPIMQALEQSEYLIVICSPRLRESLWCRKEIETFISMHGREKVLAVLIEGEPGESFPEELLYVNETVQKPDGTVETVRKPVEPLAADVRGKDKRAMLKAMRTEILRLLAPMFNLGFDDLRQRHKERRMKRILGISVAAALVCLVFGAVSTTMALRIHSQKEQIESQHAEIQAQNAEIQLQNQTLLENQAINLAEESGRQLANGDRIGAINTAVDALTEYDGIAMPHTAEAQYALTESLHVYDIGTSIKPQYQMETAGVIEFMEVSQDGNLLLTYDGSKTLTIWDAVQGQKLAEIKDEEDNIYLDHCCTFVGNNKVAYETKEGVAVYNIADGMITNLVVDESSVLGVSGIYADQAGKYLLLDYYNKMVLYDGETLSELGVYEPDENKRFGDNFLLEETGLFIAFEERYLNEDDTASMERVLRFWYPEQNTVCEEIPMGTYCFEQIRYVGDTAYVLMNYFNDDYVFTKASIMACDPATGKILWRQDYEDSFGGNLYVSPAEGADSILFTSSFDALLISRQDGTERAMLGFGNDIAGAAMYTTSDAYILFTRNGEYNYIDGVTGDAYIFEGLFQSPSDNVKDFKVSSGGFLVLPYSASRVTVCNYSMGPEYAEYEGTLPEEKDALVYSEAVGYAKEMGLSKAELATYVFYNEDESLTGVFYSDYTLEIYDSADETLLCSLETNGAVIDQFIGMDSAGNLYVAGYSSGLMLSADYELLAQIVGLVDVDKEGNQMVLVDWDEYYTVPIYTVEELLAIAQPYVLR